MLVLLCLSLLFTIVGKTVLAYSATVVWLHATTQYNGNKHNKSTQLIKLIVICGTLFQGSFYIKPQDNSTLTHTNNQMTFANFTFVFVAAAAAAVFSLAWPLRAVGQIVMPPSTLVCCLVAH